ncbi:MAG: DUF975 family protein [Lachnospiraceae bacterium]|nr:DUF975 family protein [Lachnospiraceae bacterium]
MITNKSIKQQAKESLKGNWIKYILILLATSAISGIFIDLASKEYDFLEGIIYSFIPFLNENVQEVSGIFYIIAIITEILASVITTKIALDIVDNKKYSFKDLFPNVKVFIKAIILTLVETILIALWMCLLIIPGIIKSYSYSMSLYILIKHPEYSILDCITESRHIMNGNKMNLFSLHVSFLGYYLLSAVCYALPMVALFTTNKNISNSSNSLISILLSILFIIIIIFAAVIQLYSVPYYRISEAVFYNRVSGEDTIDTIVTNNSYEGDIIVESEEIS